MRSNNDSDMAVKLGFKSFTRGGYTFHKHDWKLLNDPTFVGCILISSRVLWFQWLGHGPKTGNRAPALEMNYKASNSYNREMDTG